MAMAKGAANLEKENAFLVQKEVRAARKEKVRSDE